MKSRISISVDEQTNAPVIEIQYEHSDDVRDKLVKMFLEESSQTSLISLRYIGDITPQKVYLSPVSDTDIEEVPKAKQNRQAQ